tara:strand:- start:433 stop:606 length:174 start_codon:yes stop_codon:yes gene_type:complete
MFHIDADYIPMRADISPPHWTTNTREQAEALVKELQGIHVSSNPYQCLQNIRIRNDA